jgi:glycogen operon protein
MYLNGQGIAGKDRRGQPVTDDHFLLYFNAGEDVEVTLPGEEYAGAWDVVVDTADRPGGEPRPAGSALVVRGRSTLVLREHRAAEQAPDDSIAASVAAMARDAEERAGQG